MASFPRRVFLVALLVATVAAVMATAVCDDNCQTCAFGVCIACKSGYYHGENGCTGCKTAHCARCQAVGWCTSCERGYRLQYVTNSNNLTINKYGKCVNAASSVSVHAALAAAAVTLVYAMFA